MRKSPSSIASALVDWLNLQPEGATFSTNEVAKASNVHWVTARSYLRLFEYVQLCAPAIRNNDEMAAVKSPSPVWSNLRSEYPEAFVLVKLLKWVNRTKKTDLSSLDWDFDPNQAPLSDSERAILLDLLDGGLLTKGKNGLRITKSGMRTANSAIADFIVPSERVLSGELSFDPRLAAVKQEGAMERARHDQTLRDVIGMIRNEDLKAPGGLAYPLKEFLGKMVKASDWQDLTSTKSKTGVSLPLLRTLLELNSLLTIEKPDLEVVIVRRPTGERHRQEKLTDVHSRGPPIRQDA